MRDPRLMGWKYELAIWTTDYRNIIVGNPAHGWHYETKYTGNNLLALTRTYWKYRNNGCIKIEIRR